MKKNYIKLFSVLCSVILFISCATTGGFYQSNGKYAQNENLTPEDSVLVLMVIPDEVGSYTYGQVNVEKSPMNFTINNKNLSGTLVFPLVEPSANLKFLYGFSETKDALGNTWINAMYDCNLSSSYGIDVNVPSASGIYFAGINLDGKRYFESAVGLSEVEKQKYNQYFSKALKQALKQYKGTAWESVIVNKIEELGK